MSRPFIDLSDLHATRDDIFVRTQAELDAVPEDFAHTIYILFANTSIFANTDIKVRHCYLRPVVAITDSCVRVRDGGHVQARGNSVVEAWGDSYVEAGDNSTVIAWGRARVEAWGNAFVVANMHSRVSASGNCRVIARGNSTVEAWENCAVTALGHGTVEAWGDCCVTSQGDGYIVAHGNTRVVAFDNGHISTDGDSLAVVYGRCDVEAADNSTVVDRLHGGGVKLRDNSVVGSNTYDDWEPACEPREDWERWGEPTKQPWAGDCESPARWETPDVVMDYVPKSPWEDEDDE